MTNSDEPNVGAQFIAPDAQTTSQAQQEWPEQTQADVGEPVESTQKPIEQVRQLKMRVETLEKELAEEREKATNYMNQAMRAQADVSNVRKRLQQDISKALNDAVKTVVYEQLGVLDSFDRAFTVLPDEFRHFSWVEGMSMIQNQLFSILYRAGVTPILVERGMKFNPLEHEAVAYEETSAYPEDTIAAELQRGYKLNDQVLRPTLVKLARAPQSGTTANEPEKND